jgi:parvulin-like peptidyl-prolyl isomerase
MKKIVWYSLLFCLIALVSLAVDFGCSKGLERPQQTGPLSMKTKVAIAGDDYVTLGEALIEYRVLSEPGKNLEATPENAVKEAIYRKLAWQKAADYHDYDPRQVSRLATNRLYQPLVDYMMTDLFGADVHVTDSSIDSFYQFNIDAYTHKERRSATHILISTNPKAWEATGVDVSGLSDAQLHRKAEARINELYQEVKRGADLGELAAKYSHDSGSKDNKGSLGFFERGEMVKPFENVAFRLKKGQISKPFETRFGYHIVRVDSIIPETVTPLDDSLRAVIRAGLANAWRRRLELHFLDSLSGSASYVWNDKLLSEDINAYDPEDWVCVVNGTDTVRALILQQKELRYRTSRRVADVSAAERKDLVLSQINPFLFSSAAKKLGYAETDTMQQLYQHFYTLEVVNRIYNARTRMPDNPSKKEMEDYYNKHKADYMSDKPVNVKQIVFTDSATALAALAEIRAGADFDSTAMKYYPGEEDVKKVAYDLGWISKDEMGPDFYKAAWLTPVGEVTGPVHTDWGYHLIKVVDKKPMLDFASARLGIGRRMRDEAREKANQDWIDWLTKGKKIEVFDDILSQVDFKNREYYQAVTDSLDRAEAAADSVS